MKEDDPAAWMTGDPEFGRKLYAAGDKEVKQCVDGKTKEERINLKIRFGDDDPNTNWEFVGEDEHESHNEIRPMRCPVCTEDDIEESSPPYVKKIIENHENVITSNWNSESELFVAVEMMNMQGRADIRKTLTNFEFVNEASFVGDGEIILDVLERQAECNACEYSWTYNIETINESSGFDNKFDELETRVNQLQKKNQEYEEALEGKENLIDDLISKISEEEENELMNTDQFDVDFSQPDQEHFGESIAEKYGIDFNNLPSFDLSRELAPADVKTLDKILPNDELPHAGKLEIDSGPTRKFNGSYFHYNDNDTLVLTVFSDGDNYKYPINLIEKIIPE